MDERALNRRYLRDTRRAGWRCYAKHRWTLPKSPQLWGRGNMHDRVTVQARISAAGGRLPFFVYGSRPCGPAPDWPALIESVAREFVDPERGEPRVMGGELRYGRRGSLSVDVTHGCWFDHEAGRGCRGDCARRARARCGPRRGAGVAARAGFSRGWGVWGWPGPCSASRRFSSSHASFS